jgi:hypothetical protein
MIIAVIHHHHNHHFFISHCDGRCSQQQHAGVVTTMRAAVGYQIRPLSDILVSFVQKQARGTSPKSAISVAGAVVGVGRAGLWSLL